MFRLTLAQMRRSLGRLTAAGIAILIGTAFVTATLLAGNVMTRATNDSIAARYADADLVAESDAGLTEADVEALRAVPGVDAVDPRTETYLDLTTGAKHIYQTATGTPSDPRLDPLELADGALPTAAGEIALPVDVAERLGAVVGDRVTNLRNVWEPDPDAEEGGEYAEVREELTLVGTLEDPFGAYAMSGGAAYLPSAVVRAWAAEWNEPGTTTPGEEVFPEAVIALASGTDADAARATLSAAVGDGVVLLTPDESAEETARSMTGGEDVFTYVILGFAAVALLVAALVIANTFQVLVAQRTRTLALLRAVGANKAQLSRSVLLEAALLGAASSLTGIVLGCGLTQAALSIAGGMDLGVPLPATIAPTVTTIVVPLLVGTLVTVAAAFAPARAATRVSPLEALRPADAPTAASGAGRIRLALAALLVVGGAGLLAAAILAGKNGSAEIGLLAGVVGGGVSFVGVLVGAVFWLPRVVSLVGRLVAGTGSSARLAAANTLRNPRRTAATSTALLIGVTLVMMMSTGAVSARSSLNAELDGRYPVDLSLTSTSDEALSSTLVDAVTGDDGVRTAIALTSTTVTADDGSEQVVAVVDPAQARTVLRTPEAIDPLVPGTLLAPWRAGYEEGDRVTLTGPTGRAVDFTVAVSDSLQDLLVTPEDAATLDPVATTTRLWVELDDVTDAASVVPSIQDLVADSGQSVDVQGAAVERAMFQKMIDTVLAVVVGLLAVAVIIALIGVANTLSLSVIERRRESATLRAIGLSRSQLRWMLAIEGMLIAGVGAVLGVVLGLLYGWAGAMTALAVMGDVRLAVPWRDVAIVLAVALVAGLLASVVPGRAAARTSPVAALAVD